MITSKPLRQLVELTLDTHSMRGPIVKADVADEVLDSAPSEYWALADTKGGQRLMVMGLLTHLMQRPLPDEAIDLILKSPAVPDEYRNALAGLPRWICIEEGGRRPKHSLTLIASRGHWQANTALKGTLEKEVRVSKNVSRNMDDLLAWAGKNNLAELLEAA